MESTKVTFTIGSEKMDDVFDGDGDHHHREGEYQIQHGSDEYGREQKQEDQDRRPPPPIKIEQFLAQMNCDVRFSNIDHQQREKCAEFAIDNHFVADVDDEQMKNFREAQNVVNLLEYSTSYAMNFYEGLSSQRIYPIRIVEMEMPTNLWICLESLYKRVKELIERMQNWYDHYVPVTAKLEDLVDEIRPGLACAYRDWKDNRWHRGVVYIYADVVPKSKEVWVIDVDRGGQYHWANLHDVRPLLRIFADVAPSAIHVRMCGVQKAEMGWDRIKRANGYFKRMGKHYACSFVDAWQMDKKPLFFNDHPEQRVELFPLDYFGDNITMGDGWDGLDIPIRPRPQWCLAAESGIFEMLHKGSWKNYDHHFGKVRPIKHTIGKQDRNYYQMSYYDAEPIVEDEKAGLVFVCGNWYPSVRACNKYEQKQKGEDYVSPTYSDESDFEC